MRVKITSDASRFRWKRSYGAITVRSEKVGGIPMKTGVRHAIAPWKNMQLQNTLGTDCSQLARWLPIDMDLPVEGGQRREVVGAHDLHPWQPVAAMDGADPSHAQRAPAVIDVGLGHRAIQKPTHRPEQKEQR